MMKTRAIVIMMMFVVAGFVVPCLADFRTVGVYDPTDGPWNNDVDQSGVFDSATGSAGAGNVLVLADIQGAVILDAFNANMGGVLNLDGVDDVLDGQTIHAKYGVGGAKTLDITNTDGAITQGNGSSTRLPVSGDGRFGGNGDLGGPSFDFAMGGITGGVAGEGVIMFGGTMIERNDRNMGWTVTATFSDDSTVVATGGCSGGGSDDDTFFGFVAPAGETIASVRFQTDWTYLDELFFITESVAGVDAGGDQEMRVSEALTGVALNAAVIAPPVAEDYTYSWSGDFATIDDNNTTTAANPIVTFAAPGVYVLTVDVTGSISGAIGSDTVTITVIKPVVNAGPDQDASALVPVALAGSLSYYDAGETYIYGWRSEPNSAIFSDPNALDSTVTFPTAGEYVLTLNARGNLSGVLVPDTATFTIATNWVGSTEGDWHTAANWDSDPNIPGSSNIVYLGNLTAEAFETLTTVNISADANALTLSVANDPNYPYLLNINSGGLSIVGNLDIANNSEGMVNVLAASPLNVGGDITIGDDGVGTLSALASSDITVGDDLNIGDNGDGTFEMTGGSLNGVDDIAVSNDNDGTGTMTLDGVTANCRDLLVASNSDDEDGSGVGTVVLTNTKIRLDGGGDDLRIGKYGTGTVTATDSIIDVDDDVEIGDFGTGTLTLNNSDIAKISDGTRDADHLDIGVESGGYGELIMTGTSRFLTGNNVVIGGGSDGNDESMGSTAPSTGILRMSGSSYLMAYDQMRVGNDPNATGKIYMTDPGTILETRPSKGEDLQLGVWGTAIIEMSGTILVSDDLYIAVETGSSADITMDSNSLLSAHDTLDLGDNGVVTLTMSDEAFVTDDGELTIAAGTGVATVTMSGTAGILGNDHIRVADSSGGSASIYMSGNATIETPDGKDLILGGGGDAYLEMNGGLITVGDHVEVATGGGSANVLLDNNAFIDIGNAFRVGGTDAQVTITLKDGDINMNDGDDALTLPDSASGTGYAHLVLGEDASDISFGSAKFALNGPLDYSAAGDNDYIDFLAGGLLEVQNKPSDPNYLTEEEIQDLIISGYFRTTYTQDNIGGVDPNEGDIFRPVYKDKGDGRWQVYLGTGPTCVVPPASDLDGDCDVDVYDLRLLAENWLDPKDLNDFAQLAAEWETNGLVYGQ